MREIEVGNEFDVKILINGVPDPEQIIADKDSGFLAALELEISEYFQETFFTKHSSKFCNK